MTGGEQTRDFGKNVLRCDLTFLFLWAGADGLSHDDEGVPPWRSPARLFVPTRPKTVDKATARLLAGGSGDY